MFRPLHSFWRARLRQPATPVRASSPYGGCVNEGAGNTFSRPPDSRPAGVVSRLSCAAFSSLAYPREDRGLFDLLCLSSFSLSRCRPNPGAVRF